MLRFKQFLVEGIVDWYHRADPATAERLQKGEKIRPQGLSIFLNPEEAAKYNFETSAGHIPPNAKTVTGTVSTRRIIPDIEWHPDSYKPIFKDIAKQIQTNPDFRVPSLTTTSITPTGTTKQFVTPGIISEIDPNTGKKTIVRNWEPRFALQYPEGHPHAGYFGEPHALESFPIKDPVSGELIDIDDPRVKPMIDSKSKITPYGKAGPETKAWGGSATTHGRYQEQRDLDVLTKKSDITKITKDAIEQGKGSFRTQGGSSVSVSGAPNPSMTSSLKGAEVAGKVANVAGKAASIMDPAGEVASQVFPRVASAAGLGAEIAMGAAMIPLVVGAFTQQAGDPMGDFKASFAPGEFKKWQEEQEEARKRRNASSVQSLINRPYDPNQATARRRQQ